MIYFQAISCYMHLMMYVVCDVCVLWFYFRFPRRTLLVANQRGLVNPDHPTYMEKRRWCMICSVYLRVFQCAHGFMAY